ncbi:MULTISPECIES: hypothetical protein [Haloferax]|uniref:Uncharacterized protein n=2 Tax=Haloferax TaxID=2251 RepID=A0A6G1Z1I1_9EURY|nr:MULTISPECIES: hypothetical protein [Haloferax]KAB1187729.1 hypothetical protein Hfx1149_06640 [Haloferax sp. CBA1149]MRW80390.1 hypothetical protein [Haloferax marinisediminis]
MEKRRIKGGFLAVVGFILSPLSWWNDLVVNLPLAYAFGIAVALISRELFLPGVIAGYWLTNVAGFVLLHKGAIDVVSGEPEPYTTRRFVKDFLISVGYTVIVIALVWFGILTIPDGILAALGQ